MMSPRTHLTLVAAGALVVGLGVTAPQAQATPQDNYAAINAGPICSTLDEYPTVAGVTGVLSGIMEDSGFTAYQAGQVIAEAVIGRCPDHLDELQRFVAVYSDDANSSYVASGRVGGVIR